MKKLPNARLETNIIVPFEITTIHDNNLNPALLQTALTNSNWALEEGHTLDDITRKGLSIEEQKRLRYQAYNYFHPFVRDFWFNQSLIKRYRHTCLHSLDVSVCDGSGSQAVGFDAVCDLLYFTPNIGLLVLHIKSHTTINLKTTQACLDQLRRLYPPYLGSNKDTLFGGHFPGAISLKDKHNKVLANFNSAHLIDLQAIAAGYEYTKDSDKSTYVKNRHAHLWASHWSYLLIPISTEYETEKYREFIVRQLGDDRAALASFISLETNEHDEITTLDMGSLKRLCFANEPGTDRSAYSERFLTDERFIQQFCNDRFWYLDGESTNKPSLIMNCGYAFCWLGDIRDNGYFSDQAKGAPAIYRHIYVSMAIIAHFQKAVLLVTASKLTDLSVYDEKGKPNKFDARKFEEIKQHFIAFTQTYWFAEVTPQAQGIELFEMWRRELRLQTIYDETRQQVHDIVEFTDSREAIKLNEIISFLTFWGILLSIIGLGAGILGMNTFKSYGDDKILDVRWLNNLNEYIVSNALPIALLIALIFVITFRLKHMKKK